LSTFRDSWHQFATHKPARVVSAVALALSLLVAGLVISTSDTGSKAAPRRPSEARSESRDPRHGLRIDEAHVRSIRRHASMRKTTRLAVLRKTQRYIERAIVAPLERGRAIPGWAKIFDRKTRRFARKRDLAKVTEVRMGFRDKHVQATVPRLRADAISSPGGGRIALVALTWTMKVTADTSRGELTILRLTELTFARDHGKWQVTAYKAHVIRSRAKPSKPPQAT
jgi:hypothetical protein